MNDEIIIHENQEIMDFMEDIYDTKIFRCKDNCCWLSYNDNIEFLCICPFSEFESKSVKYNKGCEYYHNHDEPKVKSEDESEGGLFE